MRWQPIETAPKDAELLLLYRDGYGVQVGYWHDVLFGDDEYVGWVTVETRSLTSGRARPTHWMPLPEPPS